MISSPDLEKAFIDFGYSKRLQKMPQPCTFQTDRESHRREARFRTSLKFTELASAQATNLSDAQEVNHPAFGSETGQKEF
jgi:hypothetical protein